MKIVNVVIIGRKIIVLITAIIFLSLILFLMILKLILFSTLDNK